MTLQLTIDGYAKAVGCNRDTAARRLKYCPRKGLRCQRFALTDVLSRLRNRSHAVALTNAAVPDGIFWVGGDEVLKTARMLEKWINVDPEMAERLHTVRVSFFNALAGGLRSAVMIRDAERHRIILPLADCILPYVVTGDKLGLPYMGDFARAFAVTHMAGPLESELVGAV